MIGLLTFLFIAAQITLYGLELSVVLERRLWPRSLFGPPTTEADQEVLSLAVQAEQRVEGQQIDVDFEQVDEADGAAPGPDADLSDESRRR